LDDLGHWNCFLQRGDAFFNRGGVAQQVGRTWRLLGEELETRSAMKHTNYIWGLINLINYSHHPRKFPGFIPDIRDLSVFHQKNGDFSPSSWGPGSVFQPPLLKKCAQLVDTLVSSFSYDLLPWESGDKICLLALKQRETPT